MRAVDTNILIRFIVADDVDQAMRIRDVFSNDQLFVAVTVLLETEWMLRSTYRFAPARIIAALRRLVGLPGLSVQHAAEVSQALNCADSGMDFADALHLAMSSGCSDFVSFDRSLSRSAEALGTLPIVEP